MGASKPSLDFLDPPSKDGDLGMLGHYRVIDQLGKGGMGHVFRAEDTRLKRPVALKVMNRKIASTPNSRARFISEARAMAAVHHDNVATIFEVGERNKTPFMAMEMLKGSTLERFKKEKTRPGHDEIIRFAKDMARGLAAAHAQGIVHRDIKPANMWLEAETDRIKILDFGLALASTPVDHLAGRGAVIGTPGYLSPEQARSEPLDDRSDLYSVGVVLYELATGALPLEHRSVSGQLIAILAHEPRPLRELNPDIPEPLARLIHRLLEKEPRRRISSAVELEQELDRVAEECESTSEMAETLSKLQMGLDQIVKEKETEPIAAEDSGVLMPDLPDPFASLPETPAAGSGSFPAIPAQSAARPANGRPATPPNRPVNKRTKTQKAAPDNALLQKYLPVGVAAALVLIGIPVGVFMFADNGRESQPYLVGGSPTTVNNTGPSTTPNTTLNSNNPSTVSTNPPQQRRQSQPPKNENNNTKSDVPMATGVQEITDVFAPGAITLISRDKGNGSFEMIGNKPMTGGGKTKLEIAGWNITVKGNRAGIANLESRAATDGSYYVFAEKSSGAELNSRPVDHVTQPGDVFRIAYDIASVPGDGKWKGKTRYTTILGFKQVNNQNTTKWKLAEIQDQTNIGGRPRTVAYQYTATSSDVGKKPFVRLVMNEGMGRRSQNYIDNVRLTVVSKNSMAASPEMPAPTTMASNSDSPRMQSTEPQPDSRVSAKPPMQSELMPPDPTVDPGSQPSPNIPVEKRTISTNEGGGADSTVKKTASKRDSFGIKPTLAIQMRGELEIQHAYMRFDLTSLTPDKRGNEGQQNRKRSGNSAKRNTGNVTLVLNVSGKKPAAGGQIRVYGSSDEASEKWGEHGRAAIKWDNSYSKLGLSTLPLLAELEVPGDYKNSRLEVTSAELSEFVRTAPHRSVTLIIAGRSDNQIPLSFFSREGSKENAPALVIEVSQQ